jgi:hypothetical protein
MKLLLLLLSVFVICAPLRYVPSEDVAEYDSDQMESFYEPQYNQRLPQNQKFWKKAWEGLKRGAGSVARQIWGHAKNLAVQHGQQAIQSAMQSAMGYDELNPQQEFTNKDVEQDYLDDSNFETDLNEQDFVPEFE